MIDIGWAMVLLPVLALCIWAWFTRQRHWREHPKEHAFRALARRMKLRRSEVEAIRVYAHGATHCSPITVLMDSKKLQEALSTQSDLRSR